jgi:hypothetical protein
MNLAFLSDQPYINTTRKIGFRNTYLEPVFKKQVLKDESDKNIVPV